MCVHYTDRLGRHPDAYHTLYCLSGLSAAQHHIFPSKSKKEQTLESWDLANERAVDLGVTGEEESVSTGELDARARNSRSHLLMLDLRRNSIAALLSWSGDPVLEHSLSHIIGGKENRLNATHPITNLTVTHTEGIAKWAYGL